MGPMTRPMTSSVLVGRREELARMRDLVDGLVEDGAGGTVLVAGEAGVGKSRLVEAFTEMVAENGARMLVGHCVQFGDEKLPAAPLVEIVNELVRSLDDDDLDLVVGPARAELTGLVPFLGPRPADARPLEHHRLLDLAHGIFSRLASRGPLVLGIEDLHWADHTTRDLIGFLGMRMRRDPVLLVATYRTDDLHRRHPLLPALAEIQRAVRPERIDLEPLDAEATAELVIAISGHEVDRAALERVHRRSGGNPFFVEELLVATDPANQLPPTLHEVVLSRTHDLDDDAVTVVRVASAIGSDVDEILLERVAGMDRSRISTALRQLVDASFLIRDGTDMHFRHELTREVFADELLPAERSELHESIATALRELDPDRRGEIAYHWYASGNQPEAVRSAVAAGEAANRAGATAQALLHFERALELWDRVPEPDRPSHVTHAELMFLAADAADLLQDFRRSVDLARQACDEMVDVDNTTRALALIRTTDLLWNAGESGIGEAVASALDLIEGEPASAGAAWVLARAAGTAMMAHRYEESIRQAETALEMARATGNQKAEANVLNTIALCRWKLGHEGATDEMWEATRFALETGDNNEIDRGYINLSELLAIDGRHEEAVDVGLEGLRYLAEHDYRGVCAALLGENVSRGLEPLGRWEELDELTEEVLSWRRLDLDVPAPTGLSIAARVMVKRGETDRARALLEHDLEAERSGNYCGNAAVIVSGLLELELIEGQQGPDPALVETANDMLAGHREHRFLEVLVVALRGEADAATTAGYLGDDRAIAERRASADRWMALVDRQIAERSNSARAPEFDLLVSQCRAEHARAHGRDGPDPWAELVAGWGRLGHPWPHAYSQWRHAEAVLHADDPPTAARSLATSLLGDAHATATRLGAKPLLASIEDLATRARIDLGSVTRPEPEPDAPESVPYDLTPRELSVIDLVARGYSNGRIGKELFISTKTASVHVSNILRKLGAANRIEAAAIANAAGITAGAGASGVSDLELTGQ